MNVASSDEFSTVKKSAWTQKLDPDCISQILRIVCTLSSLETLSFACELHPLTGTLLEARIKLQQRLLTLLLPAEPSSTSSHRWKHSTKMCTYKNNVFVSKICNRALPLALRDIWRSPLARAPTYSRLACSIPKTTATSKGIPFNTAVMVYKWIFWQNGSSTEAKIYY